MQSHEMAARCWWCTEFTQHQQPRPHQQQ